MLKPMNVPRCPAILPYSCPSVELSDLAVREGKRLGSISGLKLPLLDCLRCLELPL